MVKHPCRTLLLISELFEGFAVFTKLYFQKKYPCLYKYSYTLLCQRLCETVELFLFVDLLSLSLINNHLIAVHTERGIH